jgi:hypothetical protein
MLCVKTATLIRDTLSERAFRECLMCLRQAGVTQAAIASSNVHKVTTVYMYTIRAGVSSSCAKVTIVLVIAMSKQLSQVCNHCR